MLQYSRTFRTEAFALVLFRAGELLSAVGTREITAAFHIRRQGFQLLRNGILPTEFQAVYLSLIHIYRNTLVYRLDKIERLTGLDLRKFDDAVVFKVAILVNKYLNANPSKF